MSNDVSSAHNSDGTPPDQASAGDVSTTGHSDHDVDAAHGAHDAHADAGHGGHGADDASDVPTLVPTKWAQLILPALILLLVAILVAGPVFNAFASRPAAPAGTGQPTGSESNQPSGAGTAASATPSATTALPTATTQSLLVPSVAPTQPPSPTAAVSRFVPQSATQTAVAVAGEGGDVTRVPVRLEVAGRLFEVAQGSGLLPDWQPTGDSNKATWIQGTVANHILYVPFSADNEALFKVAKPGDTLKLTMNTGQVFDFAITKAERAVNGPPANQGQLSVSAAMSQDHAGVTLFLTGDPAADRAVVMADFTGTIE